MDAIIIDDEKKLAESLKIMIEKLDLGVNCVGIAHNALEGIKQINTLKPTLVFLDINMPQFSGFDMLEAINRDQLIVIFTTAYEEYAVKAIRHKAFDYLLKPIDMDDLKTCIERVKEETNKNKTSIVPGKLSQIQIAVKDGFLILKTQEVIRVEADGSYSLIFTNNDKKHLVTKNLKAMEDLLDPLVFFRCHNSYIVNLHRIRKVLKTDGLSLEMDDGSLVQVSRNKRDELLSRLA